MPRNVEVKARVRDLEGLKKLAADVAGRPGQVIQQKDTFYEVAWGRLKLREFGDGTGELIAYERPDAEGPKTSHYLVTPTPDPAGLNATLSQALRIRGTVVKVRTLFLVGRTRIHLDHVEDLGDFIELEVVLLDRETEDEGQAEAEALMDRLGIGRDDLVQGAYIDHLEGGTTGRDEPLDR